MFYLLRQLAKFWIVLMFAVVAGYLLIYNGEPVVVNLPGLGEFKVKAALAYIACFALGATAVSFYFGADILKKSWELKRQAKRIKQLELRVAELGGTTDVKRRGWFAKKDPVVDAQSNVETIKIESAEAKPKSSEREFL